MNVLVFNTRANWLAWVAAVVLLASAAGAGSRSRSHELTARLVLNGHTDSIAAIAFLPDGSRAVSGSRDQTLKLWDAVSGELLHTFKGHEGPVTCVAVSADGKLIASGAEDHTVRVWDVKTGEQVGLLEGHIKSISSVGFLAGGRLVSAAEDNVRVWDLKTEKVVWKVPTRFRVNASAISADGSRVAFTEDDGVTRVWDVVARKRVGEFGNSKFVPLHVWLSPDGKQAVYQTGNKYDHMVVDFERWDLTVGKRVDFPLILRYTQVLTFTTDNKHLLLGDNGGVGVLDTATFHQQHGLISNFGELGQAVAISPDNRTVFLGSGGEHTSQGWERGRGNQIAVFSLPDLDAPIATGRAVGAVSWDVIPAEIHTRSGEKVPLQAHEWPSQTPMYKEPVFRRISENCDGICDAGAVLFHEQAGILREVLVDSDANFQDICGDGHNVWVSSGKKGVWLLNGQGEVLARCGEREGLPPANSSTICALGPGRVLVAGYFNPAAGDNRPSGGWCAAVEAVAGGAENRFKVRMLFSEKKMPADWPAPVLNNPVCVPRWITEPLRLSGISGEKPPHELWVMFDGAGASRQPVMRINADTLVATPYNLWGDAGKPIAQPPQLRNREKTVACSPASICWLGDGAILSSADRNATSVRRLPLGEQRPDFLNEHLVLDAWQFLDSSQMPFLPLAGQLYVPGKHWFRIDPRTSEAEDIGPGLRIDGELVTEGVRYEVSAVLGLCAFSRTDGCFYRFSVDGAHPRQNRGTLDAPAPTDPISDAGVIEPIPKGHRAQCRRAVVYIMDDPQSIRIEQPAQSPEATECDGIYVRLYAHPEEQQRIGVTPALLQRLDVVRRGGFPKTDFDTSRLKTLWDSYKQAMDEGERKKAAGLVLAEVRAIGERQHQPIEEMHRQFQASFTPVQW
ncbi:MAG: WD40-repeat containing protein, partial [Phycisphaerales bacterium]|nr:WD40-repeat containing protein [Phycisphaerales bacterium]